MKYSKYQEAIFDSISNTNENIIVNALAGSGKTSTLVEAVNRIDPSKSVLLSAFNKSIKQELKARITAQNCKCKTLHQLGYAACMKVHKNITLNAEKMDDIINSSGIKIPENHYSKIMMSLKKTISLAKSLLKDTPTHIKNIIEEYEIEYEPYELQDFAMMVFQFLEQSKKITKIIDFDDQIYHPVIFGYPVEKFDFSLIDEAQDLNNAQIALLMMTRKNDSRVMAVGDPIQCIYQFRGANNEAFQLIKEKLNAVEYSLPICYRCPTRVIEIAKEFAPLIEAPEDAKEGKIETISTDKVFLLAKPGDFILSRANAPLIGYCLNFLKQGVPASIAGKDIATQLLNILKKVKVKSMKEYFEKIRNLRSSEIDKAQKIKKDVSNIYDKYDCLEILAEDCKTVKQVVDKLNMLFINVPDEKRVILSTVHQSKGLQRPNVFIVKNTFTFKDQAEKNIYYVAITRTQENLYFIVQDKK